ncbi:sensor histidine kinase [Lysinibacillus alkalisoli]|uniref:histidine kinase n=1 Tax=Lysinibacillus alkalisoli TaxID=1911548 RepID=A0A917G0P1_9BACI|nr:sensor histidine kinase [Lysinibacillus alkalisoli]GGG16969.1 sensor histidine kinase [Lysinibacillus alkalisoli]
MIRFFSRWFMLQLLLMASTASFLILLLGMPKRDTWSVLWLQNINGVPLLAVIMSILTILAISITFWMTFSIIMRDRQAARLLKKVNIHDLTERHIKRSPMLLKKSLRNTQQLIETQRKRLQKLSEERTESIDEVTKDRIVAERQRLARELHDSVSQQLFAASMLLSALNEQVDEPNDTLLQVEHMVQQAQLEMRALLLHLRPVALNNKTLAQGLEELIVELQQKVYFPIDYFIEEIPLSRAEEDHLFRIAQEALSNTLRHAKATELELRFIARDNHAILRIQDNGIGFNIEQDKTASYGLQNIAERAVEIGCTYKIVSIPNEGTIVEVKTQLEEVNV